MLKIYQILIPILTQKLILAFLHKKGTCYFSIFMKFRFYDLSVDNDFLNVEHFHIIFSANFRHSAFSALQL